MYKHILIATDGSELSAGAVKHGVALARAVGAKVSFVTVTPALHDFLLDDEELEDPRPKFESFMNKRAKRHLAEAGEIAAVAQVSFDKIHRAADHPYQEIIRVAETKRCDLIVMASHGRRGVSALLLGSETLKVLTHSTLPVLVVR
jgi:nucleotide-binding universal stress UspA family protein